MKYFKGSKDNLDIIAPKTKGDFKIMQTKLNEISKGKNLSGKTYKGVINGWPGQMTGPEVIEFMIKKAAQTKGGFDPSTGYNYPQLISKFAMGAVFYNQAVDNYLDEKMALVQKQMISHTRMVLIIPTKSTLGTKHLVIGGPFHMGSVLMQSKTTT